MKPVAISLSPNTEADDIWLAWRILFQPWLWRRTDPVAQVERQLSRRFKRRSIILTSSGRSALYTLLQAYGIGHGDEVILQAFTCSAVPAAIIWAGARPSYVDIDPTTYNLDPTLVSQAITSRTKAIVVQHTFGIPGPIDELRRLATQHNVVLIEDCAHALGATYHGQPVGALGDAAILSFGRDKTLSSVFGGAVVSSNTTITSKARQLQSQLKQPPLLWIKQQLAHPILVNLLLPFYFKAHSGKAALVFLQKTSFLSKAVEAGEKQGHKPSHLNYKIPGALAYLLQRQLLKLDRYTTHRQKIAQAYRTALTHKIALPEPLADTQPSWLRFPILVDNQHQVHVAGRRHNMLLGDWYNSPLAPIDCDLAAFGYLPGSCPKAEAVAKKIVNLPTHPRLTSEQAHRVIELINENTSNAHS